MKRSTIARRLALGGAAIATAVGVWLGPLGGGLAGPVTAGTADVVYVTDVGDDRRLAGLVDNLFTGRVVAQVGTRSLDPDNDLPETQYKVQVIKSIKGSLQGEVTVNQMGGYLGANELILVEEDPLLQPGRTYLFATRLHQEMGWHTLVPVYGDVPVADAKHHDSLVARYTKAVQAQIPYGQ
jgi:hypothetical protein